MKLILASTSPYRKMLLDQMGLEYEAHKPQFNEETHKDGFSYNSPRELCEELSLQKALSLREQFPDSLILGSDQLAFIDGDILGKPHNYEKALEQLSRLQGKTHSLLTSYSLVQKNEIFTETIEVKLKMRQLNKRQLSDYIRLDEPYDCAGAYKLEKAGICLFEKIETPDHSSIIGLPLISLTTKILEYTGKLPYQK